MRKIWGQLTIGPCGHSLFKGNGDSGEGVPLMTHQQLLPKSRITHFRYDNVEA